MTYPRSPDEPPLHTAARLGDHERIRRLVSGGANVNEMFDLNKGQRGPEVLATPLSVAAGSSDGATAETVSLLLELGADPTLGPDMHLPISYAIRGLSWYYSPGQRADRLKLLIEAGSPKPDSEDTSSRLMGIAAKYGDFEAVKLLVGAGWSVHPYYDQIAAIASEEDHRRIFPDPTPEQLFPGMPTEMLACVISQEDISAFTAELRAQRSSAPSGFHIPLFCAAESGNADMVRFLLQQGADPLARDNAGRTAMYEIGSLEVGRVLLQAGVPIEDGDQHGWTPLYNAVGSGSETDRVRWLLALGADINFTRDRGYTVLMSAVSSIDRDAKMVRLLVESGADPHAVSELGWNVFHAGIDCCLAEGGREECVREVFGYLHSIGVDINHRNNAGKTPLALARENGRDIDEMVLLELGASE